LQLPQFKAEATALIGADGIEAVAVYLTGRPGAGDVISGAGGARKLRWAAKGKGKRGGARIIYVYVMIAARIYLLRCYAKNVKTDLTARGALVPRKVATKKARFGADLIEGMKLVLAHQRGKLELEQVWPRPVDVKAIRKRVKMSQAEFSRAYGISRRALQEWEQGGRQPDSAARAYLSVIAKEPAVVRRALASA
jgi:DNA-binding transcriptional regulator YiaG